MGKEVVNKRLLALAEYILPGEIIADIGTDHAYLPVYLVQSGKITRALACDIHEKPLDVARKNVIDNKLEANIELRLGDGLKTLKPGEAEVAVAAGMGGGTIKKILEDSPRVLNTLKRLILQPMGEEADLRRWLLCNGWRLVDENLIFENGHIYTIIIAEQGSEQLYDDVVLEVGPRLIEKKHPLLPELLKKLIKKYKLAVRGLMKSSRPDARIKLERLRKHLSRLEEVAEKCR